ncbi:DUF3955 domain-containing protein [Lactococcus lactis]|nr:DUF3955 domain-containing protein [Lactococcus lactis]
MQWGATWTYFFLIPLGYLFLFTSLIFLIISFILKQS